MNASRFTPLIVVALILSACSGIIAEPVNIPPAQAVQACSVGNPDAVIVGGKKYDCSDVADAMATLGAPTPAGLPEAVVIGPDGTAPSCKGTYGVLATDGFVIDFTVPAGQTQTFHYVKAGQNRAVEIECPPNGLGVTVKRDYEIPMAGAPSPAGPTAAPIRSFVSLNYDESRNDPLAVGQTQLIALYLRPAFDKDQAALEQAIVAIQQEAAAVGATVMTGKEIVIPEGQAFLVWHSNGQFVTETAADLDDVFTTHTTGLGKVWIVGPFDDPVPPREYRTFRCTEGEFWAVAVH